MANNKLEKLAAEYGQPVEVFLDEVVVPKVNEEGQFFAGIRLHVSQATISDWLKDYGYQKVTRYERPERQEQPS